MAPQSLCGSVVTSSATTRAGVAIEDVKFVKRYAKANGLSVTEVIDRYLRRMRLLDKEVLPPALDEITGLLPADMDIAVEVRDHRAIRRGQ